MGYKYKDEILQGELPEYGAIFMSNNGTKKECLRRKLFGLPSNMSDFVLHVKKGMTLFLFEFERRLLYGVYRATSDGDINIEPRAYRSTGKQFPAQVRFTTIMECRPLEEHEFQDAIKDNYFSGKKFNFGLNKNQVNKLMKLFRSKQISKNHHERNLSRHVDKSVERDSRFGDLRKDIRNRLRFVSEDDGLEAKKLDRENSDEKIVEEINDFNYGRKKKDNNDRFLSSYMTHDDDFGDRDTRLEILGKNINHSLGELRRVNDEHEMQHNFREIGGINNKDNLLMIEKIKHDHDIEDYIPIFTEPHVKHFDETGLGINDARFRMEIKNKDIMDYNRLKDEYDVRKDFRQGLSSHETVNDSYFLGHEALESDERTQFTGPTIPFSEFNQTSYSTSCNPSYFSEESSFIPLDNSPFYTISNENNPTLFPMIKSPQYHSQNEVTTRYFDDHVYGSLTKSHPMFSPQETRDVLEGSQSSLFPKFISRHISSVDSGQRVREDDPVDNDRIICKVKPHESKHCFGTDKRVSVFSRLKSGLKNEKEFETVENRDLDSSVNKFMNMLEKVVNSPIKRAGKSKSGFKQDDYDDKTRVSKIVDDETSDMEFDDAELVGDEIEGGSLVQETRLVDFKRRKKTNKFCVDETFKEKCESVVGPSVSATSADVGSACKRRKLVRPAFVEKKLIDDGVSAIIDTDMLQTCHENTPLKYDDNDDLAKEVFDSSEKVVDVSNKFVDINNMLPNSGEKAPLKDESDSKKAAIQDSINILPNIDENIPLKNESDSKKAAIHDNINMLPNSGENIPLKNESDSKKAAIQDNINMLPNSGENIHLKDESDSKKAAIQDDINMLSNNDENIPLKNESDSEKAAIQDNINMLPNSGENIPLKDESDSKKAAIQDNNNMLPNSDENIPLKDESDSKKAAIQDDDINMLSDIDENIPLKDCSDLIKVAVESLEKGDATIENLDLNMLPDSHENSPCKNDAYSHENAPFNEFVQLTAEWQKSVEEREKRSHVEGEKNVENTYFCKDDKISAKQVVENSKNADECQKTGNEGEEWLQVKDGNAEKKKDDKMCGWIEW